MMSVQKQEYLPDYTVTDYELWEGDWELIEGVPYSMSPAPTINHQLVSQNIAVQLSNTLKNCGHCKALLPVDWAINENTIVQPDNLIVCKEVSGQYLTVTPKVIFEILSPSSIKKDTGIKFDLYQQEGVEHYMLIDPDQSKATVYRLVQSGVYEKQLETINEKYVFSIDHCELSFDFSQIWDD